MSNKEQIEKALKTTMPGDCDSRLIIIVRKYISGKEIDNGHFGLICAHSTGIAFNTWGYAETERNKWTFDYDNMAFNEKYTKEDFDSWRWNSFRKLILQVENDKDFYNIKSKLERDKIPFRFCGEVFFGDEEVAIVVFPLSKENTPKYIKFLKVWR